MSESLETALRSLPHGPEFRFVDRLIQLDPGKSGEGEYTLRGDEAFLKGHFPGNPIFPGVLLVEALAQLAGTIAQSDPAVAPLENLKLTAMRSVKIHGSVGPGETVSLVAEVVGRMGTLIQARGTVKKLDGVVLLEADVVLAGN